MQYYKYFKKYEKPIPKTSMLIFQGLNNNKFCVKGFLVSADTKIYLIDKINEYLGNRDIVVAIIPQTFENKWHFDNKMKIFYDNGLLKTITGESINIFYRKSTDEYIIQVGIKKKNRKRAV